MDVIKILLLVWIAVTLEQQAADIRFLKSVVQVAAVGSRSTNHGELP